MLLLISKYPKNKKGKKMDSHFLALFIGAE